MTLGLSDRDPLGGSVPLRDALKYWFSGFLLHAVNCGIKLYDISKHIKFLYVKLNFLPFCKHQLDLMWKIFNLSQNRNSLIKKIC